MSQGLTQDLLALPESTTYASLTDLEALLQAEKARVQAFVALPLDSMSDTWVEDMRVRFSGKKSPLQDWLKSLRDLPAGDRKGAGALINQTKEFIETQLQAFLLAWRTHAENKKLSQVRDDISLTLPASPLGSRHPSAIVMADLEKAMSRMGFAVIDGPEIDKDHYNFECLNMPKDHPAREMQDTLFLNTEWLLRTHTSNVQSHAMIERGVPIRICCPGYVYRSDYDLTHVPCFRQIEGLVVDKGITLAHMRHVLKTFFEVAFGRTVNMRLRSNYFPFTEPSCEFDVQCQQCHGAGCRSCKGTGWLEMGGCGLINEKVLRNCGIDPTVYTGFAFGMGVDRIAMSRFGLSDLRALFEGDVTFLSSFGLND